MNVYCLVAERPILTQREMKKSLYMSSKELPMYGLMESYID